ncbi:MAG: type II secretion system F family protein [Acidimicrobiales bacterium]
MVTAALFALFGAAIGGGAVLAGAGLRLAQGGPWPYRAEKKNLHAVRRLPSAMELSLAGGCGVLAVAVTRWPIALPLVALAVLSLRRLGAGAEGAVVERLEAISAWTEMLAGTLAGAAGLTQALLATASVTPKAIRPQVSALAARITAGVGLLPALYELGSELDDGAGDTVVACLVLAASERAQRLSDLLSALAGATRDEVVMRREIEASRASARSAVRTISCICLGLVALLAVVARSYLAVYRTFDGELVLGAVGVIFAAGMWLMALMVRARPFPRIELDMRAIS